MAKFNKGDRIKRKNQYTGLEERGLIEDVTSCYYFWGPDHEYKIKWDSGVVEVLIASSADLGLEYENAANSNTTSILYNNFSDATIKLPEGVSVNSYKSNECSHRWKTYVGFREQFEYCEVCDAKKD